MGELITAYDVEERVSEEAVDEGASQYLTFSVADKTLAVAILDVNEIIEVSEVTALPMAPDFLRGVINLRGNAVAVVDLAVRMAEPRSRIHDRSCIVLVELQRGQETSHVLGMLVDRVQEIVEIKESQIQMPEELAEEAGADLVTGIGGIDGRFVILLDVDQLLSPDHMAQLQTLTAQLQDSAQSDSLANGADDGLSV